MSGLFALPFWPWGPAAAYNGALIIGFTLTGWCMYLLARTLGCNRWVAGFAGLVYTLTPMHLMAVNSHLTKVFLGAIPLSLLAFRYTLIRRSPAPWALATALALLAALLQSAEQWVYGLVGCGLMAVYALALGAKWTAPVAAGDGGRLALLRRMVLAAGAILLITGPLILFIVYDTRNAGIEVGVVAEATQHQPDLLQFLAPYRFGWPFYGGRFDDWFDSFAGTKHETAVFLGWTAVALALVSLAFVRRQVGVWLFLLLMSSVLALGPTLRIGGTSVSLGDAPPFSMPFAWLTSLPGLDFMRTPGRFMLLGMVGLAAASALGLGALLRRWPRAAWAVGAIAVLGVLGETWPTQFPQLAIPPTPVFYRQIAADPEIYGVLDLPMRPSQAVDYASSHITFSSYAQLDQMVHGKGIAGGYVSRTYDPHPIFARFISENNLNAEPIQQDMRVNGEPVSRYANLEFDLAQNNYRYVVVHKPQVDHPVYQPGSWGEEAARALVADVFKDRAPVADDALATVYAVTEPVTATLQTSIALLELSTNQGWTDDRWGVSPATFQVHAAQPQMAVLELTANSIMARDFSDYFEYATVTAESGGGAVVTRAPIGLNEPVRLPVALVAGSQVITLTVTPADPSASGVPDQLLRFAITSVDLRTQPGEIEDIAGMLPVAGAEQIAAFGTGWYPPEGEESRRWRWATTPAALWIYSPEAAPLTISGTPLALHVAESPDGKGQNGVLRIASSDQSPVELPVTIGSRWQAPISVHSGWNLVTLALDAGNFRPVDVQPETGDGRVLSFALADLAIQ
ncbi:MAG: hypothetical protein IPK16_24430 [Anaerolineales bacterium]|nr:hypothetical protein [Anaerolineales bacterium]